MSKIFVIMGKSATGKDSIFKRLVAEKSIPLKTAVGYTTRPIRSGEQSGAEYFFVTEDKMHLMQQEKKVIECRSYQTIHGKWYYFTANDGQIDLSQYSYLFIATLEGYDKLCKFYGNGIVVPIYIEVDDELRLMRSIRREKKQELPNYSEICRRYLADEIDFSEENIIKLGVIKRYNNLDINICLYQIMEDIKKML